MLCLPVSSIPTLLSVFKVFVLVLYCVYIIQISMNVMTTMVAVVRYAPTLKEAMNVPVKMAMY